MVRQRTGAFSCRAVSFRFRRAIRIGRGARWEGRATHTAANGNATTVCLHAGRRRLWGFRFWRFPSREEIDKNHPKSRRHNDQSTPKPTENLLIALVTQEPPQAICAFDIALGSVGLGGKLRCIASGEVNTILFEPTDQSVHIILKRGMTNFHPVA